MTSRVFSLILCSCFLTGCATLPEGTEMSPADPLERLNRTTFTFNDNFDQIVAQPVARTYVNIVPGIVRTGIGNFFGNINDVWTAANNLLQGNAQDGLSDLMRFGFNSTFGLLGLIDFATEAGIPKHNTNLGQTLGVWGVPNGPYFVIPFLGPSVVRDTVALPVDYYGDLWSYYRPVWGRNIGTAVRMVDKRASYLDASTLLEDAALDKYIFVRDAYLQRLASQIEWRKHSQKNREDAALMLLEKKNQSYVVPNVEAQVVSTNATNTVASTERQYQPEEE